MKKNVRTLVGVSYKISLCNGIRLSLVPTKFYRLTVKGGFKNIKMSQDGRISRLQSCLHHDKKNCYKSRKGPPTLFRSMQLIENFHGYTLWLHIVINNSQHGILTWECDPRCKLLFVQRNPSHIWLFLNPKCNFLSKMGDSH